MKKNLPLILTVICLIAVAFLYVFTFVIRPESESGIEQAEEDIHEALDVSSNSVVYVNIDSVVNNYDLYYDLKQVFEKKYKTSEAELASKEKAYKKEVEDYQYKIQRGLVTRSDAQKLEQQLLGQQQNLLALQENLRLELAEEEQVMLRQVLNSIMVYLEELQSKYNYQFVFGTTTAGGNVLYADKRLDITKVVVNGLNLNYKIERDKNK
jgi:outer membrane protein